MKRLLLVFMEFGMIFPALPIRSSPTMEPPMARKIHVERSIHGETLVDDYGWLRKKGNPEVLAYLEAENRYAETMTAAEKPLAERLYRETFSHIEENDISVPYRKNGYWYYSRTEEG